ncbi:MAG TPA: YkvA family protein [Pseudomonadales bacterium]
MPLNIALDLSDDDLKYFARVMDAVWKKNAARPESELIDGARAHIKQARKARVPAYIQKRLEDIAMLIDLLDDKDWGPELVAGDRRRIVAALSYFAVGKDIISDKVPGIGYLDDAVVADLVIRELKHDIEGYRDFREYRDNATALRGKKVNRDDFLASKRQRLLERIDRRRDMMRRRMTEDRLTDPILRYKY